MLHVHGQLHPVPFRRLYHDVGFFQGQGHGLFHVDVLFVLQSDQRVLRVELVRSGDVDHVDAGTPADGLRAEKSFPFILRAKFVQLVLVDVGGGGYSDAGMARECGEHLAGAAPQADYSQVQYRAVGASSGTSHVISSIVDEPRISGMADLLGTEVAL